MGRNSGGDSKDDNNYHSCVIIYNISDNCNWMALVIIIKRITVDKGDNDNKHRHNDVNVDIALCLAAVVVLIIMIITS